MKLDVAAQKIREFYREHKRLPTYREMCEFLGYASKRSVHLIIKKLIEEGIVEKDEKGRLIPKKLNFPIPVLGAIQAGFPTSADQAYFGNLELQEFIVRNPAKSYVLKVQGDSMIDAGIQPGDYVVVEECHEPQNGDIVAAQIDGDFTLKYYQMQPNGITLVPGNKKYPEFSPKESLKIYGKVVSVIRKY